MNTSCFRIGRDEISLAEDIKLLGVTLDKDFNFDEHMADIARDNQIRVLQRHKKLIDTDAKIGLYNADLLPHLDYCSIVCHHCGRRNSNKLEKLNRPFPSSCLPPLQSESKCEVFVMVISSTLHMNEN